MASNVASSERMTEDLPSVDALWLDTLQRICTRVAHELKGALNGVSVNLEVVRSRSERPEAPASGVARYASSASDQLDAVIAMTEAVLAMARAPREPVDIGSIIRRLDALLSPTARVDGRTLEFRGPIDDLGITSSIGNGARLVLSVTLLAALDTSMHVICEACAASNGGVGPMVRIECRGGTAPALDADVVAVAAEQGIELQCDSSVISIRFPR
jgi:signal transduction histidine kinase